MTVANQNDSPTKRTNRCTKRLNSVRQQISLFWKRNSIRYSNFLINYSWWIFTLSVILATGYTACFFAAFKVRPFDQNDFLINQSESMQNAKRLRELFGDDTQFRVHQHLKLYAGLDLIIKSRISDDSVKDQAFNMLHEGIIDETHKLNDKIHEFVYFDEKTSDSYNYSMLCQRIGQLCMIDGSYILTKDFRLKASNLKLPSHGYLISGSDGIGVPEFMFGKHYKLTNESTQLDYPDDQSEEETNSSSSVDEFFNEQNVIEPDQIISHVSLLRLRYSLNATTPETNRLAIAWERQVFRYLTENYHSDLIEISVTTSNSIADSIMKKAHEEGPIMLIMIIVFLFVSFISVTIEGNRLTSVGFLPLFSLLNVLLSTGTTFGILTMLRVDLIEPMTLLIILVIVIESMRSSIVCGEYHRALKLHFTDPSNIQIDQILSSIVESTQPYFIVSNLIIVSSYAVYISLSPMPSTFLMSSTLLVYIVVNYVMHSTFFLSCLVITLRRVLSRRHCLSFQRLPPEYDLKTTLKPSIFEQYLTKYQSFFEIDSAYRKFISSVFCLFSLIAIVVSVLLALSIDTRLFLDELLPRDATSVRAHMKSQVDEFHIGPIIIFTIPKSIDYKNSQVNASIRSILKNCLAEQRTNRFKLLWLDNENIDDIVNNSKSLSVDHRITPFSHNDLVLSESGQSSEIVASRFYCQYNSILGDREDIRTMHNVNNYAKISSIPSVFAYSVVFPTFEALIQIRNEIYLVTLITFAAGFIINYHSFLEFKRSLIVVFYTLLISMSTLAFLYQFHNLTFNFANALWLLALQIIFVETVLQCSYSKSKSRWQYNRILISLIISLVTVYVYPLQTYVFLIIRDTLMYQSSICLLVINIFLPAFHSLLITRKSSVDNVDDQKLAAIITDGNKLLANEVETQNLSIISSKIVPDSIKS